MGKKIVESILKVISALVAAAMSVIKLIDTIDRAKMAVEWNR